MPTDIDEKTNKKLFWLVNRRVLFIMLGTYFCQSLDKGTLNFASIMGIKDDANLKGQEVSNTDLLMNIFVLGLGLLEDPPRAPHSPFS